MDIESKETKTMLPRYYSTLLQWFLRILALSPIIIFLTVSYFLLNLMRDLESRGCPFEPLNISCHYQVADDDLNTFDGWFQYTKDGKPQQSIFFHEVSCRGYLKPREACAVESASRANPDRALHVLFSAPVNRQALAKVRKILANYGNVHYWRVNLEDYVLGTPLQHIVYSGQLNRSAYPTIHTADILRTTTLFKHPGVYLSLDVIVTQPFDDLLGNFVVNQSPEEMADGMMGLSGDDDGRSAAADIAMELASSFREFDYSWNGPKMLMRAMWQHCENMSLQNMDAVSCQGVEVYSPEFSYTFEWQRYTDLFSPDWPLELSSLTHVVHFWGPQTHCLTIAPSSVYQRLAKTHCPTVYRKFRSEFGG